MYVVQMKERSIQTLGYLPVGDGDFPHQKRLLQGLMDSVEVWHILIDSSINNSCQCRAFQRQQQKQN